MRSNELSLKDAIRKMVEAYRLSPKLNQVKVVEAWERLMGSSVAKRTTQIFVREGKLTVKLNSSVLRQELSYAKEDIMKKINEEIGEEFITDVVFV